MKAYVIDEYGPPEVLQLREIEKPVPTDDQILVKLAAVSINGSDREGLIGKPLYARMRGLRKPNGAILGSDIAGWVESVGKNVTQFAPGDEVYGETSGYHGGFAEYACTIENLIAHKPAGLTFAQAATIAQGGVIALQGIVDKGQVKPGQQVLINGAGGSAGLFAVQLAKLQGAIVTGVDNGDKLEYMRSLGADYVIDYTKQDFTKSGKQYDLILDVIASRSAFAYPRALRPEGTCFVVGGSTGVLFQILFFGGLIKKTTGKNVRILIVQQGQKDLMAVTALVEAGKLVPVIDRVFPLEQVREAMRYVADGTVKGKVVITMGEGVF